MKPKKKHTIFFFTLIFLISGFLRAGETAVRNQQAVEKILRSIMDSLSYESLQQNEKVSLSFQGISDEKAAFLRTFYVDYLQKRGLAVQIDSAGVLLRVEQFDINIVYKETKGKIWGVNDNLQRKISVDLKGWIRNNKSGRYYSLNAFKIYTDEIQADNLRQIENSPYAFTKGRLLKKGSWTKFVEPVVVSISVATVILLFFVLRT